MALPIPAQGSHRAVRIGPYQVVKHIATGGMGAVYQALDTTLGRSVALKILSLELAAKPPGLERFRREAKNAAQLRHENIVSIYEVGEENGTPYLAMELIEGIDLLEYITRAGKLKPDLARQFVLQAASALDHAHQLGIVHRDIKPANFMVSQKAGRPLLKLIDLGLARETRADDGRLTRDGCTVGTVDYMAPEQARDSGRADIRSDIYSLGCTFYHMLAGRAPFAEGGLADRIHKHAQAEPEDVRKHNPDVSPALARVLTRMLEKQPEHRYQTPAELLQALERPDHSTELSLRQILASLAKGKDDEARGTKGQGQKRKAGREESTPSPAKITPDGTNPARPKHRGRRPITAFSERESAGREVLTWFPLTPAALGRAGLLVAGIAVIAWAVYGSLAALQVIAMAAGLAGWLLVGSDTDNLNV
jgi:serine/threonine protein kinase